MELVLEDITKKYKDKTAVQNVSSTLHSGQLIGLIGKNGAGKTTLLKLLSTILKPTSGRILLDGQDIVENPNVMRSTVGYLPQEVSSYPNLTISEYLSYIASVKGIKKKDAEKQINSLLTDFHLENAKGKRMGNCSGGMKQRVGIICALLGDPQIIIIDVKYSIVLIVYGVYRVSHERCGICRGGIGSGGVRVYNEGGLPFGRLPDFFVESCCFLR